MRQSQETITDAGRPGWYGPLISDARIAALILSLRGTLCSEGNDFKRIPSAAHLNALATTHR